jgi:hypothetical protein
MRVIAWLKGLKSGEQIAAVSLLVAILGLVPTWYVLVGRDSSSPSHAATACPTLDLPDTVQRGVAFALQKADNLPRWRSATAAKPRPRPRWPARSH